MSKLTNQTENWTEKPLTWGELVTYGPVIGFVASMLTIGILYAPALVKKVKNSNKKEDC